MAGAPTSSARDTNTSPTQKDQEDEAAIARYKRQGRHGALAGPIATPYFPQPEAMTAVSQRLPRTQLSRITPVFTQPPPPFSLPQPTNPPPSPVVEEGEEEKKSPSSPSNGT